MFQRDKVIKWKDKKDIHLLSTVHPTHVYEETKHSKSMRKPQIVKDYNLTMGGVDIVNQHLPFLYNKTTGKSITNLDFRMKLIEEIIEKYGQDMFSLRLVERHFLDYVPVTGKKANPTRLCVVCSKTRDSKGKKQDGSCVIS
ncbi:hypothetical protein ILUMI_24043, partial [Ignelater luminosus]